MEENRKKNTSEGETSL